MDKKVELIMEKKVQAKLGYDKIIDVDETKDVWNLVVRIVYLWSVMSKYRQKSMEMIINDNEVNCSPFYSKDIDFFIYTCD
jgi:hypothetical protein